MFVIYVFIHSLMSDTSPLTVWVITLGCAKNLVDAEVMCGTLAVNGFILTIDPDLADITLVNTCSFIRDAREEAAASIEAALAWKAAGADRKVVVTGCLPQRDPKECAELYPEVDLFLGLDDIPVIHNKIRALYTNAQQAPLPNAALPTYLYDHESPRISVTPEAYAYVKIAEGCNHRCAFCAIPNIRGKLRSREQDSVLAECQQLLDQGVKELNFIAQDSSSYGRERGDNLVALLRRCEELPGDFWLRVLYTHPSHVNEELFELMAHGKHVLPYLDMPLQHISDHILSDMRRGMNAAQTRALVQKLREKYPQITLRSTFMVGFPGETEQDFQELLAFIKDVRFERMSAFVYSPEKNTPALQLPNQPVKSSIAKKRLHRLLMEQQKISLENNKKLRGKILRVLVEGASDLDELYGRTVMDAPEVDQLVYFHKPNEDLDLHSDFVELRISSIHDPYSLRGKLIR
ncbi:MAG: 30S ribosomal protein S12 methylthiotransferase RimO [Oligosphaeraceae bacterium]|nr:30S ribosomal protein S12 methylthiotransferase RimO [Oligosphaeraceae bacterium]